MKPIKPRIRWEQVRGPRATIAVIIGTAMGAGFFPVGPGTMGTLFAVPIHYATAGCGWEFRAGLWLILTLAGIWASKVIDEVMGTSDNQSIVVDEVVGFGITAWTAGRHPATLVAAFVLFRLFDIVKPPPIRQVDRWSKKQAHASNQRNASYWGGFGVMFDDVLAGFEALAVVYLLQRLDFLP